MSVFPKNFEAIAKRGTLGNSYLAEETKYTHDTIALDLLEDSLGKFLKSAVEEPLFKDNDNIKKMYEAHEEIMRLQRQNELSDQKKYKEIEEQQKKFADAAKSIKESPQAGAFAQFSKEHLGAHFDQQVSKANKPAHYTPTEQTAAEREHVDRLFAEAKNAESPATITSLRTDIARTSIEFLDKKNNGWSQEQGFGHYREYDQLSKQEKHDEALLVVKCHDKWDAIKKEFNGTLPPEFQKDYQTDIQRFTECGFGKEFTSGQLKDSYAEATKATGSEATLKLAENLIAPPTPATQKQASQTQRLT